MTEDLRKMFAGLEAADPPPKMLTQIMARIGHEEHSLKIKVRFVISLLTVLVAASWLVPTLNALCEAAAQSGFTGFVSLLFSDLGSVMANFGEYSLSLLGSAPFLNLLGLLCLVFVLLGALKYFVHDMRYMFPHRPVVRH